MACSKSKNNVVLIYLGLLLISSLSVCTNPQKQNIQKYSSSPNRDLQWHHGKLLIGHKIERNSKSKRATDTNIGYQSDKVWEHPEPNMVQGYGFPGYDLPEYDNAAVERLLKMDPMVACSGGYMRLQVKDADSRPGALLFVDRGELSPLSLSKLPKSCGYKVSSSRRDFMMVAPYDGCFVLVEESCYVLPLRWFGLPVQMSCPVTLPSYNTPMVTCHPLGMIIITDWTSELSEIQVNLNNNWAPLTQVSSHCNVGVVEYSDGITISFPYKPPCVEKEDGMYIVTLSGDVDIKVSCPPLSAAISPQLMDGQFSTHAPSTKNTPHTPLFDMPQPPKDEWDQFISWHNQQPAQPVDNEPVKQPFYPMYPESMADHLEHYPNMFPPNMPSGPSFDQKPGHPSKPEKPSVDSPPFYDPAWFWPDSQSYPFYSPQPVQPTVSPVPTVTSKPEGAQTYHCPFHHTTAKPEVMTTAGTKATVPQHYPFGPYHYPLSFPYLPYATPTPSTQKQQDPLSSDPGKVFVFPPHPQPENKYLMDCLQYCHVGLFDCCSQIAFHQHHYHFVPQQLNGKPHSSLFLLPGQPTGLRPDAFYAPAQGPQEAPSPSSHTTFPDTPQLYALGGPHERQPQGGNPAALPETDSSAYFNPNVFFPNAFDMNFQPEGTSTGVNSPYSEFFNPELGANLYGPYNVMSSHQSDGPPSNTQSSNLLSRIYQYASRSADNANTDVKDPALVLRRQQDPRLVPYGTLQGQHSSNHQSDVKRPPRDYVLLQHGPPGRETIPGLPYKPVGPESNDVGQNFANNFPNKPQNVKGIFEDTKGQAGADLGNSGPNAEDEPGPLPQYASASPNSVPLSQNSASAQFKYIQGLLSQFGHRHRTLKHDASQ